MNRWVAFLGGETIPWLRMEDGAVAARGDDLLEADAPVLAIAPASGVAYRTTGLAELSPAQALAAARIDAAEASLGLERHVAIAETRDHYAVTDASAMRGWIGQLAGRGLEASALVPSPSLLPVPEEGFLRAKLPHETVLRSAAAGLEEDGIVSPLVVGDAPVRTLGREEIEAAIVAASDAPALNLLQGAFAPRTDWRAEPGYWRRMALFAGIVLALTLAIPLAHWARLSLATARLDRESARIAAGALEEARPGSDSVARLEQKLAQQRGGGAGYLATQAAVVSAVEATPNSELASLSFDPDGTMRAAVRALGQPELDAIRSAIELRGFSVSQGVAANVQGRMEVQLQVRPR